LRQTGLRQVADEEVGKGLSADRTSNDSMIRCWNENQRWLNVGMVLWLRTVDTSRSGYTHVYGGACSGIVVAVGSGTLQNRDGLPCS